MNGISGITEVTPAALNRSTASGAAVLVAADSLGSDGMVTTSGVTPIFLRSGRRYCFSASWSLGRSPARTPTLRDPPSRPLLCPQATVACRMAASSVPVHHR